MPYLHAIRDSHLFFPSFKPYTTQTVHYPKFSDTSNLKTSKTRDSHECHEVKRLVCRRPCVFEAENAVSVGVLCLIFMPFGTVTYFFLLLNRTLPKPYTTQNSLIRQGQTSIPAKAVNSACFREIIGDRVPISIGKKAAKKKCIFSRFLLTIEN